MPDDSSGGIFGSLVHDVSRMRRTFFDQALRPLGITRAQWWALDNIARHAERGVNQTELAAVLEAGKVSVGGLIDRLEEAGLVDRKLDKADRRVKRVCVTRKGGEMLDRIAAKTSELDQLLLAEIRREELAAACGVLRRMKRNIRAASNVLPPSATGR